MCVLREKSVKAGPKGAVVGDGGSIQGFKVYIPAMWARAWHPTTAGRLLPMQLAVL
jgi:hypothetical protein